MLGFILWTELLMSYNKIKCIQILLRLPSPRPQRPPAAAFPLIGSPPHRPLPSGLDSASAPPCCPMADQTARVLVTSASPSRAFSGRQPVGRDKDCVFQGGQLKYNKLYENIVKYKVN